MLTELLYRVVYDHFRTGIALSRYLVGLFVFSADVRRPATIELYSAVLFCDTWS